MNTKESKPKELQKNPGMHGRLWPRSRPRRRVLDVAYNSLGYLLILLNYLVHTLPRKFEFVRNKTERFSAAMQIKNSRVSVLVRLRTWAQRAPLPIANFLEFLNLVNGKLSLSATLAEVTNPRTKRQRGAIDDLHVRGGNFAVSFARNEVVEGCNCEVESRDVVHGGDISTSNTYNK